MKQPRARCPRRFRTSGPNQLLKYGAAYAPNLETIQNRIWFSLRQGNHTCRSLQAAWSTHGEAGLTFGECERLEDEESSYVRNALLKERLLHWRAELKAEAI